MCDPINWPGGGDLQLIGLHSSRQRRAASYIVDRRRRRAVIVASRQRVSVSSTEWWEFTTNDVLGLVVILLDITSQASRLWITRYDVIRSFVLLSSIDHLAVRCDCLQVRCEQSVGEGEGAGLWTEKHWKSVSWSLCLHSQWGEEARMQAVKL